MKYIKVDWDERQTIWRQQKKQQVNKKRCVLFIYFIFKTVLLLKLFSMDGNIVDGCFVQDRESAPIRAAEM
jgi:hypothetical protein